MSVEGTYEDEAGGRTAGSARETGVATCFAIVEYGLCHRLIMAVVDFVVCKNAGRVWNMTPILS